LQNVERIGHRHWETRDGSAIVEVASRLGRAERSRAVRPLPGAGLGCRSLSASDRKSLESVGETLQA
jgi:hypothetical protein